MSEPAAEVCGALAALGKRGRTTRIPDDVRAMVVRYARQQRCGNVPWRTIALELGVSASAMQRWAKRREPPRARRAAEVQGGVAPRSLPTPLGHIIGWCRPWPIKRGGCDRQVAALSESREHRFPQPQPLTDADLDEIEALAETNAAETYRGALLRLVEEVRRLRGILLEGADEA